MTIEEFNSRYLVKRENTNSEKWETIKDKRFNENGLLPMDTLIDLLGKTSFTSKAITMVEQYPNVSLERSIRCS